MHCSLHSDEIEDYSMKICKSIELAAKECLPFTIIDKIEKELCQDGTMPGWNYARMALCQDGRSLCEYIFILSILTMRHKTNAFLEK